MTDGKDLRGRAQEAGSALVRQLVVMGVDGRGRWLGATETAGPVPVDAAERERQIDRVIAAHRRMAVAGGFATGLGGVLTLPLAVPADLVQFYVVSTRMVASIAHLRGYDVRSDEVRSMVLVTLLGARGTALLSEAGVKLGTRVATDALRRLPAGALNRINQAVGFRIVTKFGEKGLVNLSKAVPLVGGGVGAGVNAVGITAIARYAKRAFPAED